MLDQLRRMREEYEKLIRINFCVVCRQDCEIVLAKEPRDFTYEKCRAGRRRSTAVGMQFDLLLIPPPRIVTVEPSSPEELGEARL